VGRVWRRGIGAIGGLEDKGMEGATGRQVEIFY